MAGAPFTALGPFVLMTPTFYAGTREIQTSLHFDRGDYALGGSDALSSVDNLFFQLFGYKFFRRAAHLQAKNQEEEEKCPDAEALVSIWPLN